MTALLAHQLRFDLLALRRNRRMQMFGLALPLVLLVCFAGLFDSTPVEVAGQLVPADRASVPGIMGLAVLTSSFMGLAMTVVTQRQLGVLKRRRSTPCPAWVLVSSRALAAMLSSVVACAVMTAVAGWGYGFRLAPGGAVAALLAAMEEAARHHHDPVGEVDERGRVLLRTHHIPADLEALPQWALAHDLPLADLAVRPPTQEDVYLELTR